MGQEPQVNLNQVTLPCRHVERSVAFYRGMGFRPIVLSPHYARFECPEGDATFSVHATDNPEAAGVVVYFESNDLDGLVARLIAEAYEFDQMPRDEPWRWREARLRDPDGNVLCLYHAAENRRHPPWRVPS